MCIYPNSILNGFYTCRLVAINTKSKHIKLFFISFFFVVVVVSALCIVKQCVSSLLLFLSVCFERLICATLVEPLSLFLSKPTRIGYFSLRETVTVLQLVDEQETEKEKEFSFFFFFSSAGSFSPLTDNRSELVSYAHLPESADVYTDTRQKKNRIDCWWLISYHGRRTVWRHFGQQFGISRMEKGLIHLRGMMKINLI